MGAARESRIGRYELLIELGQGGMAELFLGRLQAAGGFAKLVAIKRILPHLARDASFREMFLDEGRIASRLSHPNVCQVFELDDADGELFLAMEYLDGVSWDLLLHALPLSLSPLTAGKTATAGPPAAITAGVLAQAADGLHYAHTLRDAIGAATPVVHRDVSPSNVFVTIDGIGKVLDFGVSKMMTDGPRTKSGVVKGKLPYMAPEQIRGEPVDGRADVFSLGVCLWEALCAERLYDRATDFQIWKAITEQDAPGVATRWPGCPPALAAVTARALAREAADRFPTARAFADELRAAVPDLATPPAIAEAVRTACADRLAARHQAVAAAITERKPIPKAQLADGRRTPDSREIHSAAETLDSGRSAALTLDDKPRLVSSISPRDSLEQPAIDPAATTNLRSGSKTPDIALRDKSVVVTRDSDPAVDKQAIEAERQSRLGLIIGGVVALLVIAIVVLIATRPATESATPDAAARIAPDAAIVAVDVAVAPDVQIVEADAAAVAPLIDAAIVHAPKPPPKPDPKPDPDPVIAPLADPPGSLSVSSDPYATVYVDGKKLDDTPLFRKQLAAGKHVLRAVRADGKEQTISITIEPGKERNLGKLAW